MNAEKGIVYWMTGLSGAGKTTIANMLYAYIKGKKANIVLLDGDDIRATIASDVGYSFEERKSLWPKYSKLCRLLSEQGIDVICSTIAMFDECRDWNRENIENYVEIYLNVDMKELIHRDAKGLYRKALDKQIYNVFGVDIPFDEPKNPDIEIKNYGENTPEKTFNQISGYIQKNGLI